MPKTPAHRHDDACGCGHAHPPPPELGSLTDKLRRGARKVTGPRQAILDVLRREAHPVTNKEIHAALPAGLCDLATVYRSLHLLEELGLVKRYDFGDGAARFEMVHEGETGHHHHLICTACARVVELDDCLAEAWEQRIGRETGFRTVTHRLEFFGVCPDCQRAPAAAPAAKGKRRAS
jgi:Fur family ferric uptake transcriptional regulator